MTTVSAAKAILEADATLVAAATGGIYDFDETGRTGINRTNAATAAAFDSSGVIKPCILVCFRSSVPDYSQLADDANQYVSVREMIEAYFFQDSGYTAIETMKLRVYALLHTKQLGGFAVRWAGDFNERRDLKISANVLRSDYLCIVKRSV